MRDREFSYNNQLIKTMLAFGLKPEDAAWHMRYPNPHQKRMQWCLVGPDDFTSVIRDGADVTHIELATDEIDVSRFQTVLSHQMLLFGFEGYAVMTETKRLFGKTRIEYQYYVNEEVLRHYYRQKEADEPVQSLPWKDNVLSFEDHRARALELGRKAG